MLELLLSHDVTIGLSLDGPAELTDPARQPRRALPIVTAGNSRARAAPDRAAARSAVAARTTRRPGPRPGCSSAACRRQRS